MIQAGIRNKATAESVSSRKTTPGSRQFFRETSSSVVRKFAPSLGIKEFYRVPHAGGQPRHTALASLRQILSSDVIPARRRKICRVAAGKHQGIGLKPCPSVT